MRCARALGRSTRASSVKVWACLTELETEAKLVAAAE
jgi:hypothetical protein